MSSNYGEKLVELQDAINELQMLKQIEGTDKLQRLQERKIFNIHKELQNMNKSAQLSAVDAILPLKCRTCPDKTTDEERLQCFDENHETCTRDEEVLTPLKMSILKITIMFISVILGLLLFLLATNIFSKYLVDLWAIFLASFGLTLIIVFLFRQP